MELRETIAESNNKIQKEILVFSSQTEDLKLYSFPTQILDFLKFKLPIWLFIIIFGLSIFLLPKKVEKQIEYKEVVKVDTLIIKSVDTIYKYAWRVKIQIESVGLGEKIVERETVFQKQTETKEVKKIEYKQEPFNFYCGVANQIPFEKEKTDVFGRLNFNLKSFVIFGEAGYSLHPKKFYNKVGVCFKIH